MKYHSQPNNTLCTQLSKNYITSFENNVDQDQLASDEASWSGSTLLSIHKLNPINEKYGGSVVECLTRDQGVVCLNLTGVIALCP